MNSACRTTQRRRTRGQSMVEMALVTPILLAVIVITINLGLALSDYNRIGSMAREGAYYGSLHPTDTAGISSAAIGESGAISGVTPVVSDTVQNDSYLIPNTTTYYQSITVTVTYSFKPLFTFPPVPSSMTLKRQVQMRVTGS